MNKPLLTLALAAFLVPTASAQSDPGGQSAPLPAPTTLDDSDGGPSAPLPVSITVDDSDASAPSGMGVQRVAVFEPSLNDGRDPSEAVLRVEAVELRAGDAELNGRDPDAPVSRTSRVPHDGPLLNGREGGDALPLADDASPEPAVAKTGTARADLHVSRVMPNPVRNRAALTFAAPAGGAATVVIYDLTGRRVATAFDDVVHAGAEVRVGLDLAGVAVGTYVAVLNTGRERVSRTFQVVR